MILWHNILHQIQWIMRQSYTIWACIIWYTAVLCDRVHVFFSFRAECHFHQFMACSHSNLYEQDLSKFSKLKYICSMRWTGISDDLLRWVFPNMEKIRLLKETRLTLIKWCRTPEEILNDLRLFSVYFVN